MRSLLVAAALFVFTSCACAQTTSHSPGTPPSTSTPIDQNKDDPLNDYGSPENEMRAKLVLKEEKRRYDENVARAREASRLASEVRQSYEQRNSFSSDDAKKLERLEKLAKRIRNEAGGSDSEADAEVKDIGPAMEDTVKKVAQLAGDLQKMVEKTPRWVVSATVIDQANKLIGLVQHVRGTSR